MAQVLSQSEIDALLAKVPQEGDMAPSAPSAAPSGDTVSYDFRHPNRVSKDQMRTLASVHDSLASQFGSSLSGFARTVVDIDPLSIDQITYSEYIASLSAPSCTFVFSMSPLKGMGVMDFSPQMAFSFVDRAFGGRGKAVSTQRELTGIEKSLMAKIADKAMQSLAKGWDHISKIDFKQTAFETNPQFMQIIPQDETVVVVSLQVKIQETSGVMTICYPYLGLEPIMGKLMAQNWADGQKKNSDKNLVVQNTRNILPVKADIVAVLGETQISVRELLEVKTGDVIRLDMGEKDDVIIQVGSRPKFMASPGCAGNQKAVKITQVIS